MNVRQHMPERISIINENAVHRKKLTVDIGRYINKDNILWLSEDDVNENWLAIVALVLQRKSKICILAIIVL